MLKTISSASNALAKFAIKPQQNHIDQVRLARSLYALVFSGIDFKLKNFQTSFKNIITKYANSQWTDIEEAIWIAALVFRICGVEHSTFQSALSWLNSTRTESGGWGRFYGDKARIPITALVSTLITDSIKPQDIAWLVGEWQRDFDESVRLSYKAGFYLLATPQGHINELVTATLAYLSEDQNEDGGFGPWRNHPIGSDPWSTGVVLWGLSRWTDLVDKSVIHKAIAWLERTQLPNGYWPYHYLDDGTSLALIGAVSAIKGLASTE